MGIIKQAAEVSLIIHIVSVLTSEREFSLEMFIIAIAVGFYYIEWIKEKLIKRRETNG